MEVRDFSNINGNIQTIGAQKTAKLDYQNKFTSCSPKNKFTEN